MSYTRKIVVTCAPLISPILAKEIEGLNLPVKSINRLDVETEGTLLDAMRLNLQLRTAHRVLYQLKSFTINQPNELYQEIYNYPWENQIPLDGYFSVQSYVKHPTISDGRFANLKVKDAVVDRFMKRFGRRPNSGPMNDRVVLFLYWTEEEAAIYLDTSGESLSKRGYREVTVAAPMQESLAAALLLSTQWHPSQPLINPMCGSGTIAIEAALMQQQTYPGLLRGNYSFMHLKSYQSGIWRRLRQDLKLDQQSRRDAQRNIVATDSNPDAIEAAKKNARAAGVSHLIQFQLSDFAETSVPEVKKTSAGNPVIVINPPYGARLGEERKLEVLYARIGDFFKQQGAGYYGYVFTANRDLAKKIGLKTSRKQEFLNGKLPSQLLEYELYTGSK
ncbi:THUMP domain-containing class I SAM-dependent RNA methyltransferase [Tunicatimonas pelagia]|uniref:THUMP domain-containing class I SAM-dependent RNA methyltransferase n=1 Tax=Tunicatimonas pelagia TaxID=931531 RepID=UPI0026656FBC|nr:class I SAM-dependent RNA methyltransferase [Tunicatimonas pelagia]WKN41310.1 class I SAM-dependent RNA methyltransferase [Tunicatimonas pelagia]